MKTSLKDGICPRCHKDASSYDPPEFTADGHMFIAFYCNNCGTSYREWFRIMFLESEIIEDDN